MQLNCVNAAASENRVKKFPSLGNGPKKNSATTKRTLKIPTYWEWMKQPFDYEYGETKMMSTAKEERHERFLTLSEKGAAQRNRRCRKPYIDSGCDA